MRPAALILRLGSAFGLQVLIALAPVPHPGPALALPDPFRLTAAQLRG